MRRGGTGAGRRAQFVGRGYPRTGTGLHAQLIASRIRRTNGGRGGAGLHILKLTEYFGRNRTTGDNRDTIRRLDETGAAGGEPLRRTGTKRELGDHRLDAAHERELHFFARLARADERAELLGIEEHLVVEAREDVAFLELTHGRSLGVDEEDPDADAGGHRAVGHFEARADVEASVSDLVGGGGLGGRGLVVLVLSLHRTDEPGEQEHVEGNLAEGVHSGSFVS